MLDKETVKTIASLARIEVEESDLDRVAAQLSGILEWVEQLHEVDVSMAEPMYGMSEASLRLRPDVVTDGGQAEKILANAPQSIDGFFTVPKVVE